MSGSVACSTCSVDVHNSHAGWTRHFDGVSHRLRMMGLSPDEAGAVALACYEAGIAYETAEAAIRSAFSLSSEELDRRSSELREFAAQIVEKESLGAPLTPPPSEA